MAYSAFISYSHAADADLAATLRSALQSFAKPWYRLRALRIFQDRSSLTLDPSLWASVKRALDASEYLILLASPQAAESVWVNREVEHWLVDHPLDSILLVLTGGEIVWDTSRTTFARERTTSLPSALMAAYQSEPLYLDLRGVAESGERPSRRDPRLRDAIAGLAAVLRRRPKDELIGEDVRAHRKARRLAWSAGVVTLVLALAASIAAVIANLQRREAIRQRDTANARLLGVQAEQLLDQNPELLDRSVLLAIESVRHGAGPEAEQVLRKSVALLPRLIAEIDVEPLGRVAAVSFDGSGDRLAVGGDRGLGLWRANDGERLRLADGFRVGSMALDGDGSSLRLGRDGTVVRVSLPGLDAPDTLRGTGASRSLLSGGSPGWIAWPNRDGTIEAVALADDGARVVLRPDGVDPASGRALALAFDGDGSLLAAVTGGQEIHVWALPSGVRTRRFPAPPEGRSYTHQSLALSPDGDALAAVRDGNRVGVWALSADAAPVSIDHGGPVGRLRFTPDGRRLATAGGGVVRIWGVAGGEERRVPYEETIRDLVFSPDGERIALAHQDGRVRIWDLSAPRAGTLPVPVDRVNAVALSPDARYLATGEDDGVARIWEIETGRLVRRLVHPSSAYANHVAHVEFTPDESELVVSSATGVTTVRRLDDGGEVAGLSTPDLGFSSRLAPGGSLVAGLADLDRTEVWDVRSGRRVARIEHGGSSWRPLVSPDLRLVAVKRKSELFVYALPSGREVGLVEIDPALTINDAAFSPDSRYVVVGGEDERVTVRDLRAGVDVARLPHPAAVSDVAFTADGEHLVTHEGGGPVRVFTTDTWEEVARLEHEAPVVALAAGASRLATADEARAVRVWEIPSGHLLREAAYDDEVQVVSLRPGSDVLGIAGGRTLAGLSVRDGATILRRDFLARVTSFARSGSGDHLAVGLSDGRAEAWDLTTGRSSLEVQRDGTPEDVWRVTFGADGRRLVTVAEEAHVWDLSDGSEIARMSSGSLRGAAIAPSPDGRRLALGGSSGTLTVWDVDAVEPVLTAEFDNAINSAAFSPDGLLVAAAGPPSPLVRVWRVPGGEVVRTITVDASGGLLGVAFHPDGERIMTTGRDGSVRLWSLRDGAEVDRFLQGTAVLGLDVTPDGRFMATASADHTARVWALESSSLVGLVPHDMATRSLALSGDGTLLATVTQDRRLSLWRLEHQRLLSEACERLSRNFTWGEWRQYHRARSYHKTCPGLPLHPSFRGAAMEMASNGDPEGARRQLERAKELERTLDFDVEGELERMAAHLDREGVSLAEGEELGRAAQRFEAATRLSGGDPYDYEGRARDVAFRRILDTGLERVLEGEVEEALARFGHASTVNPSAGIPATAWNGLCWFGVIHGHAADVLAACDRAVELADDELGGFFADSRGVARVAVGDTAGALADFEAFLRWASTREAVSELAAVRHDWVDALKGGEDPLDGVNLLAHGNDVAGVRMELGLPWQIVTIE